MRLARKIVPLPRSSQNARDDELAFLPAALEIVETPASPLGRTLAVSIMAIVCLAIAWASFSPIDVVATAAGRIVAAGGTKIVQPLEAGIVRAIHVSDGQLVHADDVLIELDTTVNESDRNHTQADLVAVQLEIARLKAGLAEGDDPLAVFSPPDAASPGQVKQQRDYLIRQTTEYRAKIHALDRQLDQKRAERNTIEAAVAKYIAVMPIVQQRVEIRRTSSDQQFTSRFQYLEMLQVLVEQQQELLVQRSRLEETIASLAALTESRTQAVAEFYRTLHGQLAEAERKADGLVYDLAKSERKLSAQYLRAPVDGTVQQLAVHTVGGVVTPAQMLLVVVPLSSPLEIEAMVLNRDIGFVRPGQSAEIKVDTFNFTKYGLLGGEVMSVSRDAVGKEKTADKSADKRGAGEGGASSEPAGQELSFPARVSLDRSQMRIDDNLVALTPGMAVTVEIKTGSRSIMGYLISPLLKYRHESLRER